MPYADPQKRRESSLRSYHRRKLNPEWLEKHNETKRKYYQKNKERFREKRKISWAIWKKNNPERLKVLHKRYRINLKKFVIESLGGVCKVCGFSDVRALQIDHVNGGGSRHREKFKSKPTLYLNSIKKDINKGGDFKAKYQILCANCNWIKFYEKKEYLYSKEFDPKP